MPVLGNLELRGAAWASARHAARLRTFFILKIWKVRLSERVREVVGSDLSLLLKLVGEVSIDLVGATDFIGIHLQFKSSNAYS